MRIILIQTLILLSNYLFAQDDTLIVRVTGIENQNGQVILDLFKSKDGFPMKTEYAILRKKKKIVRNGEVVFYINDLEKGEYAFALIHDENENNELDTNFMGIPKEGAASSNNAKGFMGPPSYSEAKFNLNDSQTMIINMIYF